LPGFSASPTFNLASCCTLLSMFHVPCLLRINVEKYARHVNEDALKSEDMSDGYDRVFFFPGRSYHCTTPVKPSLSRSASPSPSSTNTSSIHATADSFSSLLSQARSLQPPGRLRHRGGPGQRPECLRSGCLHPGCLPAPKERTHGTAYNVDTSSH
jgi:hypothetical protein